MYIIHTEILVYSKISVCIIYIYIYIYMHTHIYTCTSFLESQGLMMDYPTHTHKQTHTHTHPDQARHAFSRVARPDGLFHAHIHTHTYIHTHIYEHTHTQIKQDTHFLQSQGLMDYSFYIGIHKRGTSVMKDLNNWPSPAPSHRPESETTVPTSHWWSNKPKRESTDSESIFSHRGSTGDSCCDDRKQPFDKKASLKGRSSENIAQSMWARLYGGDKWRDRHDASFDSLSQAGVCMIRLTYVMCVCVCGRACMEVINGAIDTMRALTI